MENVALIKSDTRIAQVGETLGGLDRLARLVADLLGENFTPSLPATDADAAIVIDWLHSGTKAQNRKTQREYLRDLTDPRTGFLTFTGSKPLHQVARDDVRSYAQGLASVVIPATDRRPEHQLKESSQRRMLASLKGLFTHANGIGFLPFNPTKGVALPALPKSKRDKALTRDQSNKMLFTAQARAEDTKTAKRRGTRRRDYLLNELAYKTGGRIDELLSLVWADLYRTDKGAELKIRHGKGNKERVISLSAGLFDALQEMRQGAADSDYVFTSQKGGRLSNAQAWRIVARLAKDAKIGRHASCHTWRHSIGTQLIDAGAPIQAVSDMFGHADIKTTIGNYYSPSSVLNVEDYLK